MTLRALGAGLMLGLAAVGAAGGAVRAQDRVDHLGPAAAPASATAADSIRYAIRITDNNLVGLTITNYGFIGNNFVTRSPSFEYPLGSNCEHLVRAGLWIGAQAIDDQGAFTGVTTAAIDGSQGSAAQAATEFTPAGMDVGHRSTLPNAADFDPHAISEQDFVSLFSDEPERKFSTENHRPLNVLVRQENYNWSFADYAHLNIFHYVVRNQGLPMRNVWVGIYAEMASGYRGDYGVWPPTQTSSATGTWFQKKWMQWDDSLRLIREHYCYSSASPFPNNCNLDHVPFWVGYSLLGVKPGSVSDTASKHVTLAGWDWAPGDSTRHLDVQRYGIMSSGQKVDITASNFLPPNDPVELLAVGPFAELDPGDSISFDFAFVGGSTVADIQKHTETAQRAYDLNYIVPVPPPSPRFKVVARDTALDLYWDDSPESFVDPTSPILHDFEGYRVYLGDDRLGLKLIRQYDLGTPPHDTTGFNTGLPERNPVTIDGVTYTYKLSVGGLRNGFKYFAAVTAYDLGTSEIQSLESGVTQNKTMAIPNPAPGETSAGAKAVVFPNPYRVEARWDAGQRVRDHYLWFTNLPPRCTLRIYTLSGDLVFETPFDGATYAGAGARGVYDPSRELDVSAPTMSGTTYAWDLITREGQAAATGLYLFSVEDASNQRKTQIGKFLIVKSDREE